jgi:hypothetical protein
MFRILINVFLLFFSTVSVIIFWHDFTFSAIFVNEEKLAGSYEVEFNAKRLSSGVYFYPLCVDGFAISKSMIVIK